MISNDVLLLIIKLFSMLVVYIIIKIDGTSIKLWSSRILGNVEEMYLKKLNENDISITIFKIVYSL